MAEIQNGKLMTIRCFFIIFLPFLFMIFESCKSKSKFSSEFKFGKIESVESFMHECDTMISRYRTRIDSNVRKLVILNDIVNIKKDENYYLFMNNEVVFERKENILKIPERIKMKEPVSSIFVLIRGNDALSLSTKSVFTFDNTSHIYYLTFIQNSSNEDNFVIIPSNSELR